MAMNAAVNDIHETTAATAAIARVKQYFIHKYWPTRVVGGLLLLLASPIIVLLIAVVRFTSPGAGLYSQVRTGRHGKEFRMYKIRTMYVDAESVNGPSWCLPGDSRITPIGKILRLMHLDELPQLINVARGEMDLIGPRPERPQFVAWLAGEIPNYRARLQVLPGVTGLAQINLPPDETVDCVRKKLALDCRYIEIATLGLDLRILLCTFLRLVGIRHGRAARWLNVNYGVDNPRADATATDGVPYQWLSTEPDDRGELFATIDDDDGDMIDGTAPALASTNGRASKQRESLTGAVANLRRPK